MSWIQIAYLLALIYLSMKVEDPVRRKSLREAWTSFALIPLWGFFSNLINASEHNDVRTLKFLVFIDGAVSSLLLAISFLILTGVIAPKEPKRPITKSHGLPPRPPSTL
jgi:hypothetical protein